MLIGGTQNTAQLMPQITIARDAGARMGGQVTGLRNRRGGGSQQVCNGGQQRQTQTPADAEGAATSSMANASNHPPAVRHMHRRVLAMTSPARTNTRRQPEHAAVGAREKRGRSADVLVPKNLPRARTCNTRARAALLAAIGWGIGGRASHGDGLGACVNDGVARFGSHGYQQSTVAAGAHV